MPSLVATTSASARTPLGPILLYTVANIGANCDYRYFGRTITIIELPRLIWQIVKLKPTQLIQSKCVYYTS